MKDSAFDLFNLSFTRSCMVADFASFSPVVKRVFVVVRRFDVVVRVGLVEAPVIAVLKIIPVGHVVARHGRDTWQRGQHRSQSEYADKHDEKPDVKYPRGRKVNTRECTGNSIRDTGRDDKIEWLYNINRVK